MNTCPACRTRHEFKALPKEVQDARDRLICAEALLEVAVESCKDELKKRIAAAVKAHERDLSIATACRLMELPRSTFYAASTPTLKQLKDGELAQKIAEIQQDFFFTIGRRRMGALLHKRFGLKVCETTLQRVMSRYGLSARIRQVRKVKPCAGKATKASLPDNLLNRTFEATHPMHRMVTDVTYVPYFEDGEWRWGYLSLVQDLFDRSIVAWVFSRRQDIRLGLATLQLLSHRGVAEGRCATAIEAASTRLRCSGIRSTAMTTL